METALHRFARNVWLVHLTLLVAVLVFVALAVHEVYQSARQNALAEAEKRQELLAEETARGVQSYYESILSDLELLRPTNPDNPDSPYTTARPIPIPRPATASTRPAAGFMGTMLSRQLEGRLSHLFIVDKATLRVRWVSPTNMKDPTVGDIIKRIGPWLQSLQGSGMSEFQIFNGNGYHFVATISGVADRPSILVAAVPMSRIEHLFLDALDQSPTASAFLVNDSLQILNAGRKDLIGQRLSSAGDDRLRKAVESLAAGQFRGTRVLPSGFRVGNDNFGGSLLAAEAVHLPDHNWFVLLSAPLHDVDADVRQIFDRALFWAVFLACSMTAILVSTAGQLIRNRARVEQLRHSLLDRELAEARKIQIAWLPQGRPADTSLDVATANEPASHISGDFYNWFDLPDGRTAVAIGDVTGHGMSAAFLMASTQLLVRTTLPGLCDPGQCLQQVNHQLCVQAFNGQFVTMALLIIDPRTGAVDLASAGHPLPLLISNGAAQPIKADSDLVLGVEAGEKYHTRSLTIRPGDNLLFYTDGVVESESPAGERFGLPRLIRCAAQSAGPADEMIAAVIKQVSAFRGSRPRADDVTLIAVRMTGIAAVPEPAKAVVSTRASAPAGLQVAIPAAAMRTMQPPSRLP
jgi:serine phosphatase RsbU (regulator of sigma subunit)